VGELGDRRPEPEPLRVARRDQKLFPLQRAQQPVERRPAQLDAAEELAHGQRAVLRPEREQDVERAVDGADAVRRLVVLLRVIGAAAQALSPVVDVRPA
jgi:hypothetical protein